MVSPKVVFSAYHCAKIPNPDTLCAVLGAHRIEDFNTTRSWNEATGSQRIPIKEIRHPPNQGLRIDDIKSHDFVLMVLERPARFGLKVQPICLPLPNAEYGGLWAVAAGWGRYKPGGIERHSSPVLRKVDLEVSKKIYENPNVLGTVLRKVRNIRQDPCAGDSGM